MYLSFFANISSNVRPQNRIYQIEIMKRNPRFPGDSPFDGDKFLSHR